LITIVCTNNVQNNLGSAANITKDQNDSDYHFILEKISKSISSIDNLSKEILTEKIFSNLNYSMYIKKIANLLIIRSTKSYFPNIAMMLSTASPLGFNSDNLKSYVEKKGSDIQRETFLQWFVEAFVCKHIKNGAINNLEGLELLKLMK